MANTLFDKVWDAHVVKHLEGDIDVLYIDRHLIHEVTSPQAFSELETRGLSLFRKDKIVATPDHNIPTKNQHLPITEALSKHQVDTLIENCEKFDVELYGLGHPFQGIVQRNPALNLENHVGSNHACGQRRTRDTNKLHKVSRARRWPEAKSRHWPK